MWSPWRMIYIQDNQPKPGCIFCDVLSNSNLSQDHVVFIGQTVYVMLNRYPYTSGHLMIIPHQHAGGLDVLSSETRAEIMELTVRSMQVLTAIYHPDGFNIGMNIGKAAGAGIQDHIHLHIVPRWEGDTNFMSAVGEIRVLPEALDDTHNRLIEGWRTLFNLPKE
jgi:ATP adenylyltransferase